MTPGRSRNRLAPEITPSAVAIAIAGASLGGLGSGDRSSDLSQFGLQVVRAPALQFDQTPLALDLHPLLLDETPQFFELRADNLCIEHFASFFLAWKKRPDGTGRFGTPESNVKIQ